MPHDNYKLAVLRLIVMETQKLTVRLPQDDLLFIKQFAIDHNLTVTELIRRHLSHLRHQSQTTISPALDKISGILPQKITVSSARDDYLLDKHQGKSG